MGSVPNFLLSMFVIGEKEGTDGSCLFILYPGSLLMCLPIYERGICRASCTESSVNKGTLTIPYLYPLPFLLLLTALAKNKSKEHAQILMAMP